MVKIDEFIIRITDDFKKATGVGGGDTSGEASGAGLGAIAGAGAALGAGLVIATELLSIAKDALGNLLKPIKSLLTGIVKLIGELLRPLVDVVLLILRPILIILKPFIDTFKALMGPFLDIAREFGALAQAQAREGDLSGAIGLSLEAIQTILGPMIVALTSVSMQMVTSVVLESISFLIGSMLETMAVVFSYIPVIGDDISEALLAARDGLDEGLAAAAEALNGTVSLVTDVILGGMLEDAQTRLEEARETYPTEYADVFIEQPAAVLAEIAKQAEKDTETLETEVKDGLKLLQTETDSKMGEEGTVIGSFQTGLSSIEGAVTTFVENLGKKATEISNLLTEAHTVVRRADKEVDVQIGLINIDIGG